jgi:hypothetical protein
MVRFPPGSHSSAQAQVPSPDLCVSTRQDEGWPYRSVFVHSEISRFDLSHV